MSRYAAHVNDLRTPQGEQGRPDEVENREGGFVFAVDKWTRLDRFLILGAEGGTYYVDEKKLTKGAAKALRECIAEDGVRTVKRIVEISDDGRAPKNDPAIFSLAMCAGAKDPATRDAAMAALPKVCRTGTHLFHFVNDVGGFRRWGRKLRRGVAAWYTERSLQSLAHQVVKYQRRDGWSQRDVLRRCHPTPKTAEQNAIFRWVTEGARRMPDDRVTKRPCAHTCLLKPTGEPGPAPFGPLRDSYKGIAADKLPMIIQAFEEIHSGVDIKRAVALVREYSLPHECVPNELKDKPEIWEALLDQMGPTAMVRNLSKMTAIGLLAPMSKAAAHVAKSLTTVETLFAARMHPMTLLIAMKQYVRGHGLRGSLAWEPVREIIDALDEGYNLAFQVVEPTGKRHLLGLDVSNSMRTKFIGHGIMSCEEAAAAMAMSIMRVEKNYHSVAFTATEDGHFGGMHGGGSPTLTSLGISHKQRLTDVMEYCRRLQAGGTDCALPMLYAAQRKLEVDAFVILTDNETWAGDVKPWQALRHYRQKMGIGAKLVVVGMEGDDFSIADPEDAGMMDVVGFDAAAPGIIADFVGGREVKS